MCKSLCSTKQLLYGDHWEWHNFFYLIGGRVRLVECVETTRLVMSGPLDLPTKGGMLVSQYFSLLLSLSLTVSHCLSISLSVFFLSPHFFLLSFLSLSLTVGFWLFKWSTTNLSFRYFLSLLFF